MAWIIERLEAFQWACAGLAGVLVAGWVRRGDLKSKAEFAFFVFVGVITAHFMTGVTAEYFGISMSNSGGIGFLLGLFGGTLIQTIINAIKSADIWQFIVSRWGGK